MVSSEKRDVPQPWIFSFYIAVTFKIRLRSPKSNRLFVMSHLYIQKTFGKNPTIGSQDIDCADKTVSHWHQLNIKTDANEINIKSICPPARRLREIMSTHNFLYQLQKSCYRLSTLISWSLLMEANLCHCMYTGLVFWFCLCWGFTAQSTQWGHVEHGQFT